VVPCGTILWKGEQNVIQYCTHVGHVIKDLNKAVELYTNVLGLRARSSRIGQIPGGKAFMVSLGNQSIELIEPTDSEHRVGKFLEKHGEGWFHVSLRVDDIEAEVRTLRRSGIVVEDPRHFSPTLTGPRIAFIDPQSVYGAVIELNEEGPHSPPEKRL
jgi:methylmalonyl-CoA/ethylmalonyl-CoA epimerase